jgi:hypothetical protein
MVMNCAEVPTLPTKLAAAGDRTARLAAEGSRFGTTYVKLCDDDNGA